MQNIQNNDGPDQLARNQAALAAQARARQQQAADDSIVITSPRHMPQAPMNGHGKTPWDTHRHYWGAHPHYRRDTCCHRSSGGKSSLASLFYAPYTLLFRTLQDSTRI